MSLPTSVVLAAVALLRVLLRLRVVESEALVAGALRLLAVGGVVAVLGPRFLLNSSKGSW